VNEILALIFGLLLRLAIPIGVTVLIAYLLKRFDNRWQAEATQINLAASTGSQVPCWERHNCSAEKRSSCPAYMNKQAPCWQQFRDPGGRLREGCLGCDVFKEAPIPMAA
jgi:hypothetical protein